MGLYDWNQVKAWPSPRAPPGLQSFADRKLERRYTIAAFTDARVELRSQMTVMLMVHVPAGGYLVFQASFTDYLTVCCIVACSTTTLFTALTLLTIKARAPLHCGVCVPLDSG